MFIFKYLILMGVGKILNILYSKPLIVIKSETDYEKNMENRSYQMICITAVINFLLLPC